MEISKTKLFATLFAIGLVAVLVTGATYTWLSDREEISWTITVKTADIEAPKSITFKDKLAPGESVTETIDIKNKGEVTLDVTISAEEHEWVTFTFDPSTFTLEPGATQKVTVTATLKQEYETSGATLTGTIIVNGVQQHL
jgi:fimbrial isopeptide formation D2 family protein